MSDAENINSLCHQLSAARRCIMDQTARTYCLEADIAALMNVQPGGLNYHSVAVTDFTVEAMRCGERAPFVYVTERDATSAACKDN